MSNHRSLPSASRKTVSLAALSLNALTTSLPKSLRRQFTANSIQTDCSHNSEHVAIDANWEQPCTKKVGGVTFSGGRHTVMLRYDSQQVLRGIGPWRTLCSSAVHSTVFALTSPLKVLVSFAIFIVTFVGMSYVPSLPEASKERATASASDSYDLDEMQELFHFFNGLLAFLLALYVSRSVNRWWEMRMHSIGSLWDAISKLSMWGAAWWPNGSHENTAARALVLRYGLLAHSLLFKEARGELRQAQSAAEAGLSDLVDHRLLRSSEAVALAPLPCKGAVVCSWLTRFWTLALGVRPPADEPPNASQGSASPPRGTGERTAQLAEVLRAVAALENKQHEKQQRQPPMPADEESPSQSQPCEEPRSGRLADIAMKLLLEELEEQSRECAPRAASPSCAAMNPVPHASAVMPLVMEECGKARDAIAHGLTHVSTQQPFAYVHLLALSVWLAVIINALLAGLKLAYSDPKLMLDGFAWPTPSSWPLILASVARLICLPVMYDGLLGMGAQLENPFVTTETGFAADLFEHEIHAECRAMGCGCDESRHWWRATGLHHGGREGSQPPVSERSFSRSFSNLTDGNDDNVWLFGPELHAEPWDGHDGNQGSRSFLHFRKRSYASTPSAKGTDKVPPPPSTKRSISAWQRLRTNKVWKQVQPSVQAAATLRDSGVLSDIASPPSPTFQDPHSCE